MSFYFNDAIVEGHQSESLSVALYSAGIKSISKSVTYHRPRGVIGFESFCRSTLVTLNGVPNVNPSVVLCRDGLRVQGAKPGIPLLTRLLSPMLHISFWHNPIIRNKFLRPIVRSYLEKFTFNMEHIAIDQNVKHENIGSPESIETDVTVIGGGIAGLAASCEARKCGLKTMLIDDKFKVGGRLWYETSKPTGFEREGRLEIQNLAKRACDLGVKFLLGTTLSGFYDDAVVAYRAKEPAGGSLFTIKAKVFVVASGMLDLPCVFVNNDVPGNMIASAALMMLNGYGVLPGRTGVVVGATDRGFKLASQLKLHGIDATVVDKSETDRISNGYKGTAEKVNSILNVEDIKTEGKNDVKQVSILSGGEVMKLKADFIIHAALQNPNIMLPMQAGVRVVYVDGLNYVPIHDVFMETNVPNVLIAGGVTGSPFEQLHLIEGRIAGLTAALRLGAREAEAQRETKVKEYTNQLKELGISRFKNEVFKIFEGDQPKEVKVSDVPSWISNTHKGMQFVCFCRDVVVRDIFDAINRIGFSNMEMIKRYTGITMGGCQGAMCLINAALITSLLTGLDPNVVGLTRQRAPLTPLPLRVLAEESR